MPRAISGFMNRVKDASIPGRRETKKKLNECLTCSRITTLSVMISSIGLTILGTAIGLTNGWTGTNLTMVAVSIPVALCSYNVTKVAENLYTFVQNPEMFKTKGGFGSADSDKLKEHLAKNTIASRTIINLGVDLLFTLKPE